MVQKDTSRSDKGSVIRGNFPTSKRAKTIAKLNERATSAREEDLARIAASNTTRYQGHIVRATELWAKTTEENRVLAEDYLLDYILHERTIEDIAFEFVMSKDHVGKQVTAHRAAYARAFLILVYGTTPTSH